MTDLSPDPAFVPVKWVIGRLGLATTTFYARRPALEEAGFPRPDPLLKRWNREDVEAWIRQRRAIVEAAQPSGGVNIDSL